MSSWYQHFTMRISPHPQRYDSSTVICHWCSKIFKASPQEQTTVEYQQFCCQLYHACLAYVYAPLKPAMTSPEVVQCPDGHFHQAIYSIGPYIADYPEQVWLTAIVSGWCPT